MANVEKVYCCSDCDLTFALRKKKLSNRIIFCPFCGDNISVHAKGSRDRAWTEKEIKQLVDLYSQGIKVMKIAATLKRTFHGINHRIAKLKKDGVIVIGEKKCMVCGNEHWAKGFCNKCYQKWRRGKLEVKND